MKIISLNKSKNLRKSRNQEILWRMDNGESLTTYSSHESWFPPRAVVAKDSAAVRRLYGSSPDPRLTNASNKAKAQQEFGGGEELPLKLAQ